MKNRIKTNMNRASSIKWTFIFVVLCILSVMVYFFYFNQNSSHQNTTLVIPDTGLQPTLNKAPTQAESITVETVSIKNDERETPTRLEWRDYWDGVYENEVEKFNIFTNAVAQVNPVTGMVLADYVDLLKDHCGYITDADSISKTIAESELFSFLIAILNSTEGGNFQLYNEAVRSANNVPDCDSEQMWISNIQQVL